MKRRISGNELRDKLLSRITKTVDIKPTEETRIQVLSSPGNRDLLEIIAIKQPRSIGELTTLAGRLQPNVSRSLSALARAGLLTVTANGRTSVPTLTSEGRRRAEDLGFTVSTPPRVEMAEEPAAIGDARPLSVTLVGSPTGDLASDAVHATIAIQFPTSDGQRSVTLRSDVNLNELCTNLLSNWWRVLYRRCRPFKMFPLQKEGNDSGSQAMLFSESTGQMNLFIRPIGDDRDEWGFPRLSLSIEDFKIMTFGGLVNPLRLRFRAAGRFDRPVDSLLQRAEEILDNPSDFKFWKTAGALGLSYDSIDDHSAASVDMLFTCVSNEDARLDLASANTPQTVGQSLKWAKDEIAEKSAHNVLPKLNEVRPQVDSVLAGRKPWQIGKQCARNVRRKIGMGQDRPVGGVSGLAEMFGGEKGFALSAASEELLRGYQAQTNGVPVVVVKDEGPKSTTFLVSRAIGDYLAFGSREAPVLDIYSDRQAVGRAFAAEFMAPAEGVMHMIDQEGYPLDAVAEHYGVIREVVRRQYENSLAEYAQSA